MRTQKDTLFGQPKPANSHQLIVKLSRLDRESPPDSFFKKSHLPL